MRRCRSLLLCVLLTAAGCGSGASPEKETEVARHYAALVAANYQEVLALLETLKSAVDALVANPTPQTHAAAKQAWLATRGSYGQSEIARFYSGPLDQSGLEHRINAWPIDENFIDYTTGNAMAGIINMPAQYPKITLPVLALYDGRGGEENRALGFHAVEFLLWGQRPWRPGYLPPASPGGPGERPYTDFIDGGTAANQDRRRTYLQIAAETLLTDVLQVSEGYDLSNPESYASKTLVGAPHDAVAKAVRGMANLAIAELLYERIYDPYITRDPRDEESCFSQNTWIDLAGNGLGVENVYLGRFGELTGPSLSDLVKAKDRALDERVRAQLSAARAATEAIPKPFDHSVLQPDGSAGREQVKASIDAWTLLIDSFRDLAAALDISLNYTSR